MYSVTGNCMRQICNVNICPEDGWHENTSRTAQCTLFEFIFQFVRKSGGLNNTEFSTILLRIAHFPFDSDYPVPLQKQSLFDLCTGFRFKVGIIGNKLY